MYVDVLLLTNFIFNFYLLWLTSLLAREGKTLNRIALGAFLGALFSLTVFFPELKFFVFWKLFFSLLMTWSVFWPCTLFHGLKILGIFYLVTFITGGVILAFAYFVVEEAWFLRPGIMLIPTPGFLTVLLSLTVVILLARFTWLGIWDLKGKKSWKGQVTIRDNGQEQIVSALIDTGNRLREPISGTPVIVIYYQELSSIIKGLPELEEEKGKAKLLMLTNYMAEILGSGLCLIPYSSLGNTSSFIPGFRPEEVIITTGETTKEWNRGQVIIGLSPEKLFGDGIKALVHPELIL